MINYACESMHAAAARVANGSESMSEAILGCNFHEKKVKTGSQVLKLAQSTSRCLSTSIALTVKDAFLVRICKASTAFG